MCLSNLATWIKIVQCASSTDAVSVKYQHFNSFHNTGVFLHPLKISENQNIKKNLRLSERPALLTFICSKLEKKNKKR